LFHGLLGIVSLVALFVSEDAVMDLECCKQEVEITEWNYMDKVCVQ
jgi:hypothetical protein